MPSKNIIKTYIENGFYHIYNRGVEKRQIFLDDQDRHVFLNYLKTYLSPKEILIDEIKNNDLDFEKKEKIISEIYINNNFYRKIELISFVLMPNHFHLELKQIGKKDIESFMRSLITKYSKYFNKKYERVGPLFQGRYKAVLIKNVEYLQYLSKYIHQNPQEILVKNHPLESYSWSSYPSYLNKIVLSWLKTDLIKANFFVNGKYSSDLYKIFVEVGDEINEKDYESFRGFHLD